MPDPMESYYDTELEKENENLVKKLTEPREESKSLIKRLADLAEKRSGLTFRELRDKNIVRCEEAFGHPVEMWSINDWAVATFGEAAEAIEKFGKVMSLLNKTKKIRRSEDNILVLDVAALVVEIQEEIADIVIYADLFMSRLGGDLESEIVKKFNKVSEKMNSDIKL